MLTNRKENHFVVTAMIVCMMSLIFIGCETADTASSTAVKKPKIPSFSFHKPKEFGVAVSRMRELHDAIVSDDPLPSPIEYQVKEVVHGEGEAGHSHYFLHDENETDESAADDGHETTGENILNVSVGPIVEQKDIIRWLPKIASAGDMPESDWTEVNAISKEMTPELYKIIEASADDDNRRDSYRAYADTVSKHIATLEKLVN